MFERYNEQARRVIIHAQEEARALKQHYVGTEHILLALTRDQTEPCTAVRILKSLNVRREGILGNDAVSLAPAESRQPETRIHACTAANF